MPLIVSLQTAFKNLYITSHPQSGQLEKPIVMEFLVNDVGDVHSHIDKTLKQKFDSQITPSELAKALSNPLFSEVRTVEVNGGEPTLRQDLTELVDVLFRKLPKLSGIGLITNSLDPTQVIARIKEISKTIESHDGHLDVMVSLDGVGEVHDRVRGIEGNFDNAVKVIDFIKNSELVDRCRLGCTIIKENVYGLHDLLEFALSKDIYIKYHLGIPHQRLYSKDVVEPFKLTFTEKYHLANFLENITKFYEKSEQQNLFYKSLTSQLVYQKPRLANCDWQHRGVTLSPTGELLYCAVASKILGSAITEDSEKLYFGNREHLAEIVDHKYDRYVHNYIGLPPKNVLVKNYTLKASIEIVPEKFRKLKIWQPIKLWKQQKKLSQKMVALGVKQKLSKKPATYFPHKNDDDKRKILICGWYGTETLGDKAILGGIVKSLQANIGEIEIHITTLERYISEMTVKQMSELDGCQLHSIAEAIQLAASMDSIVFGGGPIMAISEILDMLAIFQRGVEAEIPTLVAGCGVGPLGSTLYNQTIKLLLENASYRIYRDTKSLEIAASLGIDTSKDRVAEDPAFTWLISCLSQDELSQSKRDNSQTPQLILGLRDWTYREYAPELSVAEGERIKQKLEKEIVFALEKLVDRYPNLKIVPFPMCTNHIGHDDRWFYRRLFRNNIELANALDLSYLGAEINPQDAVKVFHNSSVALTMRFHALVFALANDVSTVAIDYTLGRGKVKSLAEKYSVPHRSLDEINAEFIFESCSKILESKQKNLPNRFSPERLSFNKAIKTVISLLREND